MYLLEIKNINVSKEFEKFEDIKKYVYKLHEKHTWLAGSTWDWHNSFVYKDGKKIGRVSYNGRVWDLKDKEKEILR